MPRLVASNGNWGAVDHPETGELVQLDESHSLDVCEAVVAAYDGLSIANGDSNTDTDDESESEGNDTESDESEAPDYAAMDYAELRQLASQADTDAINGRSSKADIIAYFEEE